MPSSPNQRLAKTFLEEEKRGVTWSMQGRLAAIAIIAIWVSVDNFGLDTVYFLGLLGCFAALGTGLLLLSRSAIYAPWMKYAFVALDAALLTFTLLVPSPFRDFVFDIQLQLRFGNFPYFFVILVGIAAFTYSPRFVVTAGVICAFAWAVGASLIIFRPDTLTFQNAPPATTAEEIGRIYLDPSFVATNTRITEILTILIVAGILTSAASRSRELVVSQAEAARQRANLARYLSPNMLEQLSTTDEPFGSVQEQQAAVLFVDIVGFTEMSTQQSPQEVIGLLREFHSRMAQSVFANNGTLDKFIGDGVMATFGTPKPQEDDAGRALKCAQDMLRTVAAWNEQRLSAGQHPIHVGIGVHFGPVVTGDTGDRHRLEFAVVGDTVNVASRLERLTRELNVALAVSHEVTAAAGLSPRGAEAIGLRHHGPVTLRGRAQHQIDVWTQTAAS